MDETVNPQGNESPAPMDVEAAFDDYLKRQANPAGADGEKANAEGAGDGQPEAEADAQEAAEAEEQRFKVKVNGEEREVPLSELLKGYSLESDYRVKTSQVAEQARHAQAQYQQAQAERQHYAQAIEIFLTQVPQVAPPDPSLIEADPVEYLRQQRSFENSIAQRQYAQQEHQRVQQIQAYEQQQAMQSFIAQQQEALLNAVPEWKDEVKRAEGTKAVRSWLGQQGFNNDEISNVADARMVQVARKAMLYDQMMAKQTQATQKVASLPPKPPLRPGSGETSATDGRTRAMQNLKKSGSLEDAANAFASMLAR